MSTTEQTARRPEILIVEDNFLTASEVSDMVRDCGFRVAGTAARLKRGLDLLAEKPIDGAIIDINLDGTYSFPLAAELDRRHVPYCFLTGYPASIIPPDFHGTPLLTKPADREQIRSALSGMLRQRAPVVPTPPAEPRPQPQPQPQPAPGRGNTLLQSLDAPAWAALGSCLEPAVLAAGEVLQESGKQPEHIVFPTSGAVSLEAGSGKERLQVALVGREGMVGTSLLLGGAAPNTAVVQFAGAAWRAPAEALAARLAESPELHRQLLRGVNGFVSHLSLTALANSRGTIEQRLARWLLTAAERLDGNGLAITHEMLSQVLGVRRAGVTVALHMLESKQALRSERRRIRILDRDKLGAIAGPYRP
jgi:CRP-like cAMP-binding protein/CheY-like chemotaxis protein